MSKSFTKVSPLQYKQGLLCESSLEKVVFAERLSLILLSVVLILPKKVWHQSKGRKRKMSNSSISVSRKGKGFFPTKRKRRKTNHLTKEKVIKSHD